jgi:hypothetical protein
MSTSTRPPASSCAEAVSRTRLLFRLFTMSLNLRRVILAILAVAGTYTGVWAYFAPGHWHSGALLLPVARRRVSADTPGRVH